MNLNVVLVGLGMMGRNHARILDTLENVNMVGIVDSISKDEQIKTKVYETIQEINLDDVDYCVVATPTITHESIAGYFLEKNIPLLIEKPIAHDVEAAKRIVKIAQDLNVVCGVGHIERYNAALQEAKRYLDKGFLGKIYQISTCRQGPFPSRVSDVGVIKDLATHDIDTSRWLVGSNYKSVSSNVAHITGRKFEDLVITTGEMENGVIVNHVVNWVSPLKERKTVITGERGTFVVDTISSDLVFYENGSQSIDNDFLAHFKGMTQGNITSFAFSKPEALLTEHQNFRDALLNKASKIVTMKEGLENLIVAEAMIESAASKAVVKL
jgi:UDP-N-acetylglucosamine 3-dehydrogenase